jgi:hypothetical protein
MKKVVRGFVAAGMFLLMSGLVLGGGASPDVPRQSAPARATTPTVDFISTAHADATCGDGGFRCGDLSVNGTCCADGDHCCPVRPDIGSCYCVSSGSKCDRYN